MTNKSARFNQFRKKAAIVIAALLCIFAILSVSGPGRFVKSWITDQFAFPLDPAFDVSPNGKKIVFTGRGSDKQNLYLLDIPTNKVTRLTDSSTIDVNPVFSPDGQFVYYASTEAVGKPFHIFILSLSQKKPFQIIFGEASDDWPSISPDGHTIAFARATLYRPHSTGGMTWDDYEIYTMRLNGSERRLTNETYHGINDIQWNERGNTLTFIAEPPEDNLFNHDVSWHVYSLDVNKLQQPTLLNYPVGNMYGRNISRDGQITVTVFSPGETWNYDLYVQRGNEPFGPSLGVSKIDPDNHSPIIMPDNKSIYYLRGDFSVDDPTELWKINIDGTNPHRVAGSKLFTDPMHWTPASE